MIIARGTPHGGSCVSIYVRLRLRSERRASRAASTLGFMPRQPARLKPMSMPMPELCSSYAGTARLPQGPRRPSPGQRSAHPLPSWPFTSCPPSSHLSLLLPLRDLSLSVSPVVFSLLSACRPILSQSFSPVSLFLIPQRSRALSPLIFSLSRLLSLSVCLGCNRSFL